MFGNVKSPPWQDLSEAMVNKQVISRGVKDLRVIAAMKETPRHLFAPDANFIETYGDFPLPIGYGQTISQPFIVAFMTELLRLTGTEKILEIGSGSGYQSAILSLLAKEIYSVEIIPELAASASFLISHLNIQNVFIKSSDGYSGWAEHAPFQRIIITAAPAHLPVSLLDQLSPGGIMVVPVGEENQKLMVLTKNETGYIAEENISVRFVPMVRQAGN